MSNNIITLAENLDPVEASVPSERRRRRCGRGPPDLGAVHETRARGGGNDRQPPLRSDHHRGRDRGAGAAPVLGTRAIARRTPARRPDRAARLYLAGLPAPRGLHDQLPGCLGGRSFAGCSSLLTVAAVDGSRPLKPRRLVAPTVLLVVAVLTYQPDRSVLLGLPRRRACRIRRPEPRARLAARAGALRRRCCRIGARVSWLQAREPSWRGGTRHPRQPAAASCLRTTSSPRPSGSLDWALVRVVEPVRSDAVRPGWRLSSS